MHKLINKTQVGKPPVVSLRDAGPTCKYHVNMTLIISLRIDMPMISPLNEITLTSPTTTHIHTYLHTYTIHARIFTRCGTVRNV